MTTEQIKRQRLQRQHLLTPASSTAVVQDLCGLQAQYLSHSLHGLSIRTDRINTDGMVKSWTLRGTMHLFSVEDLPLFLHEGRSHFLRPVDTMGTDAFVTAKRKAYFAELIVDAVSAGTDDRESLKQLCQRNGMTDREEESLFNPWGGLIRALCERGKLCCKVQEKKTYMLCPDFIPMEKEPAQLELARRYFTHYGPATVRDAAYFFGTTQAQVRQWLKNLPVNTVSQGKDTFYYTGQGSIDGEIPRCLFLAGFDPLLLGYEKTESLFLPRIILRDIFTLSGIVRPAILTNGTVTGWWNYKNRRLTVTDLGDCHKKAIEEASIIQFPDLNQIVFQPHNG